MFSWFKKPKPPQTWSFPRGRIQELESAPAFKKYRIISDDGVLGSCLLLELESLDRVAVQFLNAALHTIGDIKKFRRLYANYRNTVSRQKPPIDCNKRLTLTWVRGEQEEVAWVIDFRTTLPDRIVTLRLFPAIASYQFVEESDWYQHMVTRDWFQLFIEAVKESDITAIQPLYSDLVSKRIKKEKQARVMQRLELYWKQQGLGESTPLASPKATRSPSTGRIPYEAIAALVLEKHRNRESS